MYKIQIEQFIKISPELDIYLDGNEITIEAFPDEGHILFEVQSGSLTDGFYQIYSLSGKMVKDGTFSGSFVINLNGYSNGTLLPQDLGR